MSRFALRESLALFDSPTATSRAADPGCVASLARPRRPAVRPRRTPRHRQRADLPPRFVPGSTSVVACVLPAAGACGAHRSTLQQRVTRSLAQESAGPRAERPAMRGASRRQLRSTRLWFTLQPLPLSTARLIAGHLQRATDHAIRYGAPKNGQSAVQPGSSCGNQARQPRRKDRSWSRNQRRHAASVRFHWHTQKSVAFWTYGRRACVGATGRRGICHA